MTAHLPSRSLEGLSVRSGGTVRTVRALPEETAVALVYNGSTQAVMMASPQDLEEFAVGFSLTEGIVATPAEIESLEIEEHEGGIEARMWIAEERAEALGVRRRAMAGPVGCGLCGIDSIDQAVRPVVPVPASAVRITADDINAAVEALRGAQILHDRTRAVHAAGFWQGGRLAFVREDVGRHNALDKLAGAIARAGVDGSRGAIVLTSRISLEMVQKTAAVGAPVLVAVSAPTAHAVRLADTSGITLAANARGDDFDVFTHPNRVDPGEQSDVA